MKASVQKTISTENACGGLLVTFFFFKKNEIVTLTLMQHGTLVLFPFLLCSKLYGCKYSFFELYLCCDNSCVGKNLIARSGRVMGFRAWRGIDLGSAGRGKEGG